MSLSLGAKLVQQGELQGELRLLLVLSRHQTKFLSVISIKTEMPTKKVPFISRDDKGIESYLMVFKSQHVLAVFKKVVF